MKGPQLYVIEYELGGERRSFIIRLERMDDLDAWHWASCDAGIGVIPRFGQHKISKVSRAVAERNGLRGVHWRVSGQGPAFQAALPDPKNHTAFNQAAD